MINTFAWLLGIDNATAIDSFDLSLAAQWAQGGAFWLFLFVAALVAGSIAFYLRLQNKGSARGRIALGTIRGLTLALLLVTLADPVVQLGIVKLQRPLVYLVLDGTDSMAISDELTSRERVAIEKSVGWQPSGSTRSENPSRLDYVQSLLRKRANNMIIRLATDRQVDVEAFLFDGNTTSQLRKLTAIRKGERRIDPVHIAEQLTSKGQVTALGSVLEEISQQFGSSRLAGVVLVSDFAQNSGISPLGEGPQSPAVRLGVPLYAVGVGATEAIDLAVDMQTDPKMKKAERTNIIVNVRQSGLDGQTATIRVSGRKLSGETAASAGEVNVGQRAIVLSHEVENVDFPFTPDEAGRFEFVAKAEKLPGEVSEQNNQAARQLNIIDDYLRLMYVAYEPTWEWRFVKEVFHRDKLVGMQGFRTFLSSSDPRVRESNVLFLPTLTPKRSEFFATDVLFLDDMPRSVLSDRFCEMAKEYVGNLGGGLVVIAGPRFGPRELYQTALADMLPVIVDPGAELRAAPDYPEFRLRLTPLAASKSFMQLGADQAENAKAWDNLGKLPWYQPVAMPHSQAEVLAEHPTDKCADGKTPQPLIAIRKYGKGEVVYLGFNEMWRLRRRYGEKYYRQFWSQLIYRLGMSHALGPEKRFVTRLDQQQYRSDDKVTLTVEAYDENYEPLGDDRLNRRGLEAELVTPGGSVDPLVVPMLRKGVFEAHVPVFAVGGYSLRVYDPVSGKSDEQRFEVTPISVERRRSVRDDKLQAELARVTDGQTYDLTTIDRLPDEIKLKPVVQHLTRNIALWATPLWFTVIVGLLLGEWLFRKIIHLT